MFAEYEIPVAYSLVALATEPVVRGSHPIQAFTCYWAAFNNIYVTIAEQSGRKATFCTNGDGTIRTKLEAGVRIPRVRSVSERDQLNLAFRHFPDELKSRLVEHPSTNFFVHRTPHWHGQPILSDINEQRLNGVLNVGCTLDVRNPVWAPIDVRMYEEYHKNGGNTEARDELAQQVLWVLYTVRNNTFHGGKRVDDANDRGVLTNALSLLAMIVKAFMR